MKQFYPKPMVPMESRDSEGVPFASVESLWADIWLKGDENGHVTIKIENVHIDTCRKIHWFSFRSMAKVTKLSRKNVSEQWRHQALGRLELPLVVNTSC